MTQPGASGGREPPGTGEDRRAHAPRSPRPRRRLLPAVGLVLLVAAGTWYFLRRGPGDDLARLQGEWSVAVAGRENVAAVRVDGDRWTYSAGGRDGLAYRLTLRPERSPKEIDLAQLRPDGRPATTNYGRTGDPVGLHGAYAFDGGTVRLALAPMTDPRPAADDPDAQRLTLTRAR